MPLASQAASSVSCRAPQEGWAQMGGETGWCGTGQPSAASRLSYNSGQRNGNNCSRRWPFGICHRSLSAPRHQGPRSRMTLGRTSKLLLRGPFRGPLKCVFLR
eukprot:3883026-Alexandrium_andersonii.AAC.1